MTPRSGERVPFPRVLRILARIMVDDYTREEKHRMFRAVIRLLGYGA